jgi:hypothetical protein
MDTTFEQFLSLQNNFSYNICKEIFPNNTDHYWNKWIHSNNNILSFISRLDSENRNKVFSWLVDNQV